MLKTIALAGVFFLASAISVSAAVRPVPAKTSKTIVAPSAPAPQGWCPYGVRC